MEIGSHCIAQAALILPVCWNPGKHDTWLLDSSSFKSLQLRILQLTSDFESQCNLFFSGDLPPASLQWVFVVVVVNVVCLLACS